MSVSANSLLMSSSSGNLVDGLPLVISFCSSGHFEENDHHIEKFEKFENSMDFPIIFPYTYGYAGAACLTPRGWGPFFESKKQNALSDI